MAGRRFSPRADRGHLPNPRPNSAPVGAETTRWRRGANGRSPARSPARGGRNRQFHGRGRPSSHRAVERLGARSSAGGRGRSAIARPGPTGNGPDRVRGSRDRAGAGDPQRDRSAAQGPVDAAGPGDRTRDARRRRNRESASRADGRRGDAPQRAGCVTPTHRRRVGTTRGRGRGPTACERGGDRAGERSAPARRAPARRSARGARPDGVALARARADRVGRPRDARR